MAGADYRDCDVCGDKVFYDACLCYEFDEGKTTLKNNKEVPYYLGNLGNWIVLCKDCSKKYELQVVTKKTKKVKKL